MSEIIQETGEGETVAETETETTVEKGADVQKKKVV